MLGKLKVAFKNRDRIYYQCERCQGVFLDSESYISREDEKRRYQEHNNDVEDPRYQNFVEPIVSKVLNLFNREHKGLDFGAGTGPVISKFLRGRGYSVELYDPYFWNNPSLLLKKYDFIVCSEVIGHFRSPAKEFKLLGSLLNPGARLLCQVEICSKKIDFKDCIIKTTRPMFFYHRDTLLFIREIFGFSDRGNIGRLIQFEA
jgi:SAM-dependent methyltransferase